MPVCTRCSTLNSDDALYCKACGNVLGFDRTSVTMASAAAGVLIGFCATIMTLLMTTTRQGVNQSALNSTLALLVLSIGFFWMSTEYYILSAWKAKTMKSYTDLASKGSKFYSLGMIWLVISFGTMFLALHSFPALWWMPGVVFFILYVYFYSERTEGEPLLKQRLSFRKQMLAILILGIVYTMILGIYTH